jgi:hypothetical protein
MFNKFLGFTGFSAKRTFALRLSKDRGLATTQLHVEAAYSSSHSFLA